MFGLLKPHQCLMNAGQKMLWRFHYCSICKTLGWQFGQELRTLLNSDVVFMAEILSALSEDYSHSSDKFLSMKVQNCFTAPKNTIPQFIKYSASINILLFQMKLLDRIEDSNSITARVIQKIFKKKFEKAGKLLQQYNYPISQFWHCVGLQNEREARILKIKQDSSSDEIFEYLSEPTAVMTGLTFKHAAYLINRIEKSLYERLYQSSRPKRIKTILFGRWHYAKKKTLAMIQQRFSYLPERNLKALLIFAYLITLNFLVPQDGFTQDVIEAGQSGGTCQKILGCCCLCVIIGIINRAIQQCCCNSEQE